MNGPLDSGSEGSPEANRPQGRAPVIVRRSRFRRFPSEATLAVLLVGLVVGAGVYFDLLGPAGRAGLPGACPTGFTLQGEGASLLAPLESSWNMGYRSATSNQVNYDAAGAGAGISAFEVPSVDFAATDEPLSAAEYRAMHGTVLTLPVAGGALAIIYNLPGIVSPIHLSGSLVAGIYLGTVSNWNSSAVQSINPGVRLPMQTILAVHRSDAAGTTFVLSNFLSEDSAAWSTGPGTGIQLNWPAAADQQAQAGNSKVIQFVERTPYSLGYADLPDVVAVPGLQYATVQNPAGEFVLPTLADTTSAIADLSVNRTFPSASSSWTNVSMVNSPGLSDYPLVTFAYFLVYQLAEHGFQPAFEKSEVLVQWLRFVVDGGQNDSTALGYVPIPASLTALDDSAIGSIAFDGRPPACIGQ